MQNKQLITSLYRSGREEYEQINKELKRAEKIFPIIAVMKKGEMVSVEVSEEEKAKAMDKASPILSDCKERIEILETTWLEQVKKVLRAENKTLYNRFISQIRGGRGGMQLRYIPGELEELIARLGELEYKLDVLKVVVFQFYRDEKTKNPFSKYRRDKVIFNTKLEESHILFINGKFTHKFNEGDFLAKYIEDALKAPNTYVKANKTISSSISKIKFPKSMRKTIFDTTRPGFLKINPKVTVSDLSKYGFLVDDALNEFKVFLLTKN